MPDNPPLEPEPPAESGTTATIANVSGGVNLDAQRDVIIDGDVVGRDKIVGYTVEQVSTLLTQISSTFQPKSFDGRCPYLGLDAFSEDDADRFFGRETLVSELVARVKESRFIVIAGPSGSGKSSLVRAGLIHALKQGTLPNSDRWLYATLTPGRDPVESLALAMSRMAKSPDAGKYVREHSAEPGALHEFVESQLSDRKDQRAVIFVDQFEETFTQVSKEDERLAFLNLLTHAATQGNGRVTVLFALRSDFVSNCATYPQLNALLNQQFMQVGAMQPVELVSAIARPALQVGLRINPDLVAQIVNDMQDEPGALPLMQFALKDLFDAQQAMGGMIALTLNDYLARGGLRKALERHADAAFAKLSESEQQLARTIFSRLIEIGRGTQDTRRIATFDELVPTNVNATQVEAVVLRLADARLITTDEQDHKEIITIAHETLIEAWPWLRKLINENRDAIALQNQIAEDAKEWDDNSRDASYLYSGARLAAASEQLEARKLTLGELGQAFIRVGIETEQTQLERKTKEAAKFRRLAIGAGTVSIFALFFLTAAIGLLIVAVDSSNRVTATANVARARLIIDRAQRASEDDPMLGMRLALEALAIVPSSDPQNYAAVFTSTLNMVKHLQLGTGVSDITFSANAAFFVLIRGQSRSELRRTADGSLIALLAGKADRVFFSPDPEAAYIVVHYTNDTLVELIHTKTGSPITRWTGEVNSVIFSPSPSAAYFVVTYEKAPAELRRTVDGILVTHLAGQVEASNVAFSHDQHATYLFVRYSDNNDIGSELRRTTDGSVVPLIHAVSMVHFSPEPDSPYFVVDYADKSSPELRSMKDTSRIRRLDGFSGYSVTYSADPDKTYFVVNDENVLSRTVRRISDNLPLAVLTKTASSVSFSPNPTATYFIVSYAHDPPTELRRIADDSPLLTDGRVGSMLFNSPGNLRNATYFAVNFADDRPTELRRMIDGGLVVTLTERVRSLPSVPGFRFVVVNYIDDTPSELRNTVDGTRVTKLAGKVETYNGISFSPAPSATYFVVNYTEAISSELRRTADGSLIAPLAGKANTVSFSPAPSATYFVVNYTEAISSELRRTADGSLIAPLTGKANTISFSPAPSATYFVVNYTEAISSELRQTADGALVTKRSGKVESSDTVSFSPAPSMTYFVVNYTEAISSELRRTADGSLIAPLTGKANTISFSPAPSATYFVVNYTEAISSEVRQTENGALVATLAARVNTVSFSPDPDTVYFVVRYTGNISPELRQMADASLIKRLPTTYSPAFSVSYSPDPGKTYFVVNDPEVLTRTVRRTRDGSVVTRLTGAIQSVFFSADPAVTYFAVQYANDRPPELYRTADGSQMQFPSHVSQIYFSPDPKAELFAVKYEDQYDELRRLADGSPLPLADGADLMLFSFNTRSVESPCTVINYVDDADSESAPIG